MTTLEKDTQKLKDFIDKCITEMENGEYAYVCDGYNGGSDGGKYDNLMQANSRKIVDKLVSLGYEYTTHHGYGCKDWKFSKPITL